MGQRTPPAPARASPHPCWIHYRPLPAQPEQPPHSLAGSTTDPSRLQPEQPPLLLYPLGFLPGSLTQRIRGSEWLGKRLFWQCALSRVWPREGAQSSFAACPLSVCQSCELMGRVQAGGDVPLSWSCPSGADTDGQGTGGWPADLGRGLLCSSSSAGDRVGACVHTCVMSVRPSVRVWSGLLSLCVCMYSGVCVGAVSVLLCICLCVCVSAQCLCCLHPAQGARTQPCLASLRLHTLDHLLLARQCSEAAAISLFAFVAKSCLTLWRPQGL